MDSKDIIQFLKSEPMTFTYEEIEQMMDDELSKAPEEMDTDFVDLCADVLNNAVAESTKKKKIKNKRIKFTKILSCAVIIVAVLGIARVTVQELKTIGTDIWAKIPSGYICLRYNGKNYAK